MKDTLPALAKAAIAARDLAYAPYSGFKVGAALLTADGKIYTGCNIENAALTPGNCAERTAFFKAVSEGARDFAAIAVAGWAAGEGETPGHVYPCGVCRQVMAEFCRPDFLIASAVSEDDFEVHTLAELFPHGFGPGSLGNGKGDGGSSP